MSRTYRDRSYTSINYEMPSYMDPTMRNHLWGLRPEELTKHVAERSFKQYGTTDVDQARRIWTSKFYQDVGRTHLPRPGHYVRNAQERRIRAALASWRHSVVLDFDEDRECWLGIHHKHLDNWTP